MPESLFLTNKKETLAQVFSCEIYEIPKNTFFTEHLWMIASDLLIFTLRCNVWLLYVCIYWNKAKWKTWYEKQSNKVIQIY